MTAGTIRGPSVKRFRPWVSHFADRKQQRGLTGDKIGPTACQALSGGPCGDHGVELMTASDAGHVDTGMLRESGDPRGGVVVAVQLTPRCVCEDF
jgi:hypothetical protein